MLSTRTDLAMESFDHAQQPTLSGVAVSRRNCEGVCITEVEITENAAARELGKPRGRYLTLESALLRERDPDARLTIAALLGDEIAGILPEADPDDPVIVVGLGNRSITPDALGPGVVERTLTTRHLLEGPCARMQLRSVCAVAPGVLGVTGIETLELVEALVRAIRPRAVLCVDSLAARDARRIGSTIQLSDAGIQPGSGVGNHRQALTREALGTPVISVGMPTVIYAATLARDAFAWLATQSGEPDPSQEALSDMEQTLLSADIGEMIVTPREIDAIIREASGIIAAGINRALQPDLTPAQISAMMD